MNIEQEEGNSLIKNFGLVYWLWAMIEYHTDAWSGWNHWLNNIATHQMNKIARRKLGCNIFWEPEKGSK